MNYINKFDNIVEKYADEYIRNKSVIFGIIFLFLMLYSAHIAPKLPSFVINIFDNSFFKLFVFVLILWVARVSLSLSILIAVVFLMTTNVMNNKKLLEFIENEPMENEGIEDVDYIDMELDEQLEENMTNTISGVNALDLLIDQAMSPFASSVDDVTKSMTTIAKSTDNSVTTLKAITELGEKAASNTSATIQEINKSATTILNSIQEKVPISTTSGIQALNILSNATVAAQTLSPNAIKTTTQTIIKAIPETPLKQQAINNVLDLAEKATTKAPVQTESVIKTTKDVVNVLLTDTSGWPPNRQNYDLSKIETYDEKNYASFTK